jgi:glutathione S-transferase
MASVFELLTIDNPVFKSYGFWSAVLVLKVLAMALVTSRTKRKKSVSYENANNN